MLRMAFQKRAQYYTIQPWSFGRIYKILLIYFILSRLKRQKVIANVMTEWWNRLLSKMCAAIGFIQIFIELFRTEGGRGVEGNKLNVSGWFIIKRHFIHRLPHPSSPLASRDSSFPPFPPLRGTTSFDNWSNRKIEVVPLEGKPPLLIMNQTERLRLFPSTPLPPSVGEKGENYYFGS